jgi:hypothetical protein
MDVLETVQKLMNLANSPVEEEARTAAMKAIRLIQEHKLLMVTGPSKIRKVEIQQLAELRTRNLVGCLQDLAKIAIYPTYTPRSIADLSLDTGEISEKELPTFVHYARQSLKMLTTKGVLEYSHGKGYRLVYTLCDMAA